MKRIHTLPTAVASVACGIFLFSQPASSASLAGAIFAFPDKCPNTSNWEVYANANGRVLIGAGSVTDTAGNTFTSKAGDKPGQVKYKLAANQLPDHKHNNTVDGGGRNSGAAPVNYSGGQVAFGGNISITNGGIEGRAPGAPVEGYSVLPPSLSVVYCRLRTE